MALRRSVRVLFLLAVVVQACGGSVNPPTTPTIHVPLPNAGLACGVERWFVKTLADPDAGTVNLSAVTAMSIHDLNELPVHCDGGPDRRTYPEEYKVFEVIGRISFIAREDDRDYHVALEDPDAPGYSVVTELADTECAGAISSPHFTTLRSAQGMFDILQGNQSLSRIVGRIVRVRGVGFYDFAHGQRGRSRNCIELHPMVAVEPVSVP